MTLLSSFGFALRTTSGSGRKFIHTVTKATLLLHGPHPGRILKAYQLRAVIDLLKNEGYIQ